MRELIFHKNIKSEKKKLNSFIQREILKKRRKRRIIPEEYFIDVITTIPERKNIVEMIDI